MWPYKFLFVHRTPRPRRHANQTHTFRHHLYRRAVTVVAREYIHLPPAGGEFAAGFADVYIHTAGIATTGLHDRRRVITDDGGAPR